jgi:hypothetical protein
MAGAVYVVVAIVGVMFAAISLVGVGNEPR